MVRVLFVRHSKTLFNVEKKASKEKFPDKKQRNGYFQSLRNLDFVDSDLTPDAIGITYQAIKDNAEALAKVKYVIVSPMIRALHTAELLFGLPNPIPDIKFIVHPALRTKLTTIYNVPFKYLNERKRFQMFDWSMIDQRLHDFGFGWFAHELHTPEHRHALEQILHNSASLPLNEQVTKVLDYMQKIYPGYAETRLEKFLKMADFQVWLADFIQKHDVKDGEICVVSHSSTLLMLVTPKVGEDWQPDKASTPKLGNTEFVLKDINDTFVYKWAKSDAGKAELKQLHDLTAQWDNEYKKAYQTSHSHHHHNG